MQDAYIAAADDLVTGGIETSGIPLTDTLRHYLTITLARFISGSMSLDKLTVRVVSAMDEGDAARLRRLADTCLIAVSLFEARLRHAGGSLTHYSGLGQTAYDAAHLTEQAYGFPHMRDVVVAATGGKAQNLQSQIDAAKSGSTLARDQLAREGIALFPTKPRFIQ